MFSHESAQPPIEIGSDDEIGEPRFGVGGAHERGKLASRSGESDRLGTLACALPDSPQILEKRGHVSRHPAPAGLRGVTGDLLRNR
ncbi:hypothetical protein M2437_003400 [Methylorubrum pseudosasae]|nr:hypothetical protein [Methylorubrum pseudosasae]